MHEIRGSKALEYATEKKIILYCGKRFRDFLSPHASLRHCATASCDVYIFFFALHEIQVTKKKCIIKIERELSKLEIFSPQILPIPQPRGDPLAKIKKFDKCHFGFPLNKENKAFFFFMVVKVCNKKFNFVDGDTQRFTRTAVRSAQDTGGLEKKFLCRSCDFGIFFFFCYSTEPIFTITGQ